MTTASPPATLVVIPIGPFPSRGILSFPVGIPTGFPRMAIPMQATCHVSIQKLDTVLSQMSV